MKKRCRWCPYSKFCTDVCFGEAPCALGVKYESMAAQIRKLKLQIENYKDNAIHWRAMYLEEAAAHSDNYGGSY